MKKKLSGLLNLILSADLWSKVLFLMFGILIFGAVYFFINYSKPSRPEVYITQKEFKTGKLNDDLYKRDEVTSEAKLDDFTAKYNAVKAQLPKAEWDLKERKLTKEEYEAALAKYDADFSSIYDLKYGILSGSSLVENLSYPSKPDSIAVLHYSMKTFLENLYNSLEIDSSDFDSKIKLLEKIEHFYSLSDKTGGDTLLVSKFKNLLSKSSKLTLEEILSIEKLHEKITNTKIIFSLRPQNEKFQRQNQLFNLYDVASRIELTPNRFEYLDTLVTILKTEKKFKDTIAIINTIKATMEIDFSQHKEKNESIDDLEIHCAKTFFSDPYLKINEKNINESLSKYIGLYDKKLDAANLEKKAKEILREENKRDANKYMYFAFSFICMSVLIIQLINKNNSK